MTRALPALALAVTLTLSLAAAQPAFAVHPQREEARRLVEARDYAPAIDLYRGLVSQFPDDTDLLIEAARVEGFADRNAAAADLYERALHSAPTRQADILPSLAWQSLWAGRFERAAALFQQRMSAWSDEASVSDSRRGLAQALLGRARSQVQSKDYAGALDTHARLAQVERSDAERTAEVARVLGYADRNADAVAGYRRAIELAPERRADWLLPLAWQTLWAGDAVAARALFAEAHAAGLGLPDTWRGLAQSCAALDRHHCAAEAWGKLLQASPDDRPARRGLARALLWSDRYDEAETEYRRLLTDQPDDAEARQGLAQVLNFSGRHRAAAAEFERIPTPTDGKGDEGRRVSHARALYWAGYADKAMALLEPLDDPNARWLRDWRIRREVQNYASATLDYSEDADRLSIVAPSATVGLRLSPTDTFEVNVNGASLHGYDQPLQSIYRDTAGGLGFVVSDLNGGNAAAAARTATEVYDSLIGALADQRVSSVPGLNELRGDLDSALGRDIREAVAANDAVRLNNLLSSPEGNALISRVAANAQKVIDSRPAARQSVSGTEVFASYSWRIGDVDSPRGTLRPSVSLGVRDYDGWQSLAWRLRARYDPADLWRIDAEVGNGLINTIGAIRNRVTYTSTSVGLQYTPAPRWEFASSLAFLSFDDGNDRVRLTWRAGRAVQLQPARIILGMEGNVFTDSRPWTDRFFNRGYYNPDRYFENRLFAALYRERQRWTYYAKAAIGRYNEFDGFGSRASGNNYLLEGWVAYDIGPGWQLRAAAGMSDSEAGSPGGGSGYWRRFGSVTLNAWF
ncbi:MAG: tetratricopeptide repeat protein [Pseudomonadota bacterium]